MTSSQLAELAEIINTLAKEEGNKETRSLLDWLSGTFSKMYDQEEQEETILENCLEFEENPKCFLDL